jgi:hypothetical protein
MTAMGQPDSTHVIQTYGVPNEVYAWGHRPCRHQSNVTAGQN